MPKIFVFASINEHGETTLTRAFSTAIDNAEKAADARAQADAAARARRAGARPPARRR